MSSSQRNENGPAQANGGGKVPYFRYELSPRRWDRLGVSIVAHTVALIVLVQLTGWLPKAHEQRVQITTVTPLIAPKLSHPPKILPPPPRVLARLQPPPKPAIVLPEPTPQPEPPKIQPKVEEIKPQPPVEVAKAFPVPDIPKPVPQPKKEVVVNTFDSGSSAKQTVKEPLHKVQTGGFGDPNGVAITSDKKSAVQLASLGSFDRPAGPGDGNGTAGKHGTPGTVAPAGFGDGIAAGGNGDHGRKAVNTASGFGDASPVAGPGRRAEAKPDIIPVEITFKPRPIYTEEARKQHVQGEVLLEVMFTASGELRIQRVVRGLGHGLDEAAQRAAGQIRFKPAKRDGQAYDSVALVHINFELAE